MYKAAQAKGGAASGAGPSDGGAAGAGTNGGAQKKDEGVIDAEYVDVEDKK
jgi:molecular chaperone DnaK